MSLRWKDSLSSRNILDAAVFKESDADNLLGHERDNHYWFPQKKSVTVNRASYAHSLGNIHFTDWMIHICTKSYFVFIKGRK